MSYADSHHICFTFKEFMGIFVLMFVLCLPIYLAIERICIWLGQRLGVTSSATDVLAVWLTLLLGSSFKSLINCCQILNFRFSGNIKLYITDNF
jgi:hypothetical protein